MIQLLNNLVLLEPEPEQTRAGLYVPDDAKDTNFAVVRAVGPGRKSENGRIPIPLQVGDRVMLSPVGGRKEIELEGKPYLLMDADNIEAVMEIK